MTFNRLTRRPTSEGAAFIRFVISGESFALAHQIRITRLTHLPIGPLPNPIKAMNTPQTTVDLASVHRTHQSVLSHRPYPMPPTIIRPAVIRCSTVRVNPTIIIITTGKHVDVIRQLANTINTPSVDNQNPYFFSAKAESPYIAIMRTPLIFRDAVSASAWEVI